ncbi:MAG: hypothetical protein LKJ22_01010 [Liquorilactobacillus nagelii]|jgi:hypothetical protein|uniref:Phage protein n=1 Tax=Liquorilactobacillus hordei TaxID=468911 RepID=A0A3S6QNT3_9LACO|nr:MULTISPECIES: hypothetical protein [Liquorilactobacillus]AUJ29630.1 hypothetical protein BSQ49_05100 [Liquorilactobacillus hordei]MCI1920483.1 hypothetical protein [Liquorilactobacillus nagelii]MCI1976127.1 hypothetical protein [Liquorilactobacillus nagelii]
MKDMMMNVYNSLMGNDVIKDAVYDSTKKVHNIKFFDTPDGTLPDTFILIRPMRPPQSAIEGSDESLATDFLYQLDVQSTVRMTCKTLQSEISKSLKPLGFTRYGTDELDDYFSDTKHYVDARRYYAISKLYDTDY